MPTGSTAALQCAAASIQEYGSQHFPFQHRYIKNIGEKIQFDLLDIIGAALCLSGLERNLQRSVAYK
ncbi:hypothetical protein ACA910_005209 [Epithemia clementina (nom. ined.)]